MKVKLATQVLSQSVAIALEEAGDNDVLETAKFCRMMNSFFDCTNVRSRTEHIHKKNEYIKPYTSLNDERFEWLLNIFFVYLENWRKSTLEREGNYKSDARDKMFLSQQTYEGLKIFVHSHVEAINFLLENGFEYVLSERSLK